MESLPKKMTCFKVSSDAFGAEMKLAGLIFNYVPVLKLQIECILESKIQDFSQLAKIFLPTTFSIVQGFLFRLRCSADDKFVLF